MLRWADPRKTTPKSRRKFIDFVLKWHVTCLFVAGFWGSWDGDKSDKSGKSDEIALQQA
jgi:hypothetical protein